ncbi:MAG: hypothetical protein WCQ45_04925 [bacterium]
MDSRCQGQAEESNRALWDEMARVHIETYIEIQLLRRGEEILAPVEVRDELGVDARFLESNVYGLCAVLDKRFDVVYTSRGVLCWLRNLEE